VIINRGKIAAVDTPANLTGQLRGGENVSVEIKAAGGKAEAARALLERVSGVRRVTAEPADSSGRFTARIECEPGRDLRSRIAEAVVGQGHELYELRAARVSLEDIFLQLTTQEAAEAPPAAGGEPVAVGGAR